MSSETDRLPLTEFDLIVLGLGVLLGLVVEAGRSALKSIRRHVSGSPVKYVACLLGMLFASLLLAAVMLAVAYLMCHYARPLDPLYVAQPTQVP